MIFGNITMNGLRFASLPLEWNNYKKYCLYIYDNFYVHNNFYIVNVYMCM